MRKLREKSALPVEDVAPARAPEPWTSSGWRDLQSGWTVISESGRSKRGAGTDPSEFKHSVAHVSVFGQMRGSNGLATGRNHLVEGTTLGELRVEFTAKFTKPAGSCVEATDDGMVDMFHGQWLLGRAKTDSPGCGAETHTLPRLFYRLAAAAFVLQRQGMYNCFVAGRGMAAPGGQLGGVRSGKSRAWALQRQGLISGMIGPRFSGRSCESS